MKLKEFLRNHLMDLVAGALTASMILWLSSLIPQKIADPYFCDSYFGSDVSRAFSDLTTRLSAHGGSTKHPLVGFFLIPSYFFQHVLSFSPWQAVQIILAVNGFIWAVVIFQCCKRITSRKLDAFLLTLLATSTGSAIFWLPMPETFAFGSTTVILPLILLLRSKTCKSYALHMGAHVMALGVTITNWTSAMICSYLTFGKRRSAVIAIYALSVFFLLMALQPLIAPQAGFINVRDVVTEMARFRNSQNLPTTLKHIFLTSLSPGTISYRMIPEKDPWPSHALPNIDVRPRPGAVLDRIHPPSQILQSLQYISFLFLLGVSLFQFFRFYRKDLLLVAVHLTIAAQFLITLIYGKETFICSLHWMPLLVMSLGTTLTSKFRRIAMVIVIGLVAANLVTNVSMFRDSMNLLRTALIIPR